MLHSAYPEALRSCVVAKYYDAIHAEMTDSNVCSVVHFIRTIIQLFIGDVLPFNVVRDCLLALLQVSNLPPIVVKVSK